jgi:hypothetical protein
MRYSDAVEFIYGCNAFIEPVGRMIIHSNEIMPALLGVQVQQVN